MKTKNKVARGSKLAEWQRKGREGGICKKDTRWHEYLTVEHIVPAYLLLELGLQDIVLDDEENFELQCKPCNSMKGPRIDVFHPKTIPLLKKYVAIVEQRYAKINKSFGSPLGVPLGLPEGNDNDGRDLSADHL